MKRVVSISLALLLSAGVLAAQQSNMAQFRPHCPIAMRAQHMADGEMVRTGNARPQGIGQWLRLTLAAPDARRIAKATLTIRGMGPKGRMMEALRNGDDSFDAVVQQTLSFTAGADRRDLAELWVPGMTAVEAIEIGSVTYTDGSTWKYAENMACRVTPDGFMPIDSSR